MEDIKEFIEACVNLNTHRMYSKETKLPGLVCSSWGVALECRALIRNSFNSVGIGIALGSQEFCILNLESLTKEQRAQRAKEVIIFVNQLAETLRAIKLPEYSESLFNITAFATNSSTTPRY